MKVVDVNLLVFCVNTDAPQHAAARQWWDLALAGSEEIGLPWATLLGFLRPSTNQKVFPKALTLEEAMQQVDAWLKRPCVRILHTAGNHWTVLQEMLRAVAAGGNWVPDAHLAALAREHNAELLTNDLGFTSFPGVRWANPLVVVPNN